MLAFLRFFVAGFVILTVVYIVVSIYSRSVRRGKLEREWEEEIGIGDRAAFVEEGLKDYDHSLRRKLILGVYIVPMMIVGAIIYITNYL